MYFRMTVLHAGIYCRDFKQITYLFWKEKLFAGRNLYSSWHRRNFHFALEYPLSMPFKSASFLIQTDDYSKTLEASCCSLHHGGIALIKVFTPAALINKENKLWLADVLGLKGRARCLCPLLHMGVSGPLMWCAPKRAGGCGSPCPCLPPLLPFHPARPPSPISHEGISN